MGKTALASFIGHVSSFNFGAVLGGTPVRYRLYTAFGLSGGDVLKLIALSTATFWIGFLALAGLMFLWDPLKLPAELHMPFSTTTPIGWALIAITLVYLGLSYARVTLRWNDWEFTLPPLWLSLVQLVIAATDLLIATAVLHVLLPKAMGITFGYFLAVYLLAVVTVLFTHVPAGAGVLEFVLLLLLAPSKPAALLGSILAFRVVYYLLPLALAMILLVGHEIAIRRHQVGLLTTAVGRWAPAVAPPLLSVVMVLAGASLLLAGAMPAVHTRLEWLNAVLPLGVIEASHLLGSVCGLMLVILARGLQLRLDSAYWLSVVVLIAAILCTLTRGLDVEQALLLVAVLVVLLPCRPYFYRHAALLHEPFSPGWLAAIGAIIIATGWLTAFSFKHVEYSNQLWWKFRSAGRRPPLAAGRNGRGLGGCRPVAGPPVTSRLSQATARKRRRNGLGPANRRRFEPRGGQRGADGRQVVLIQRHADRVNDVPRAPAIVDRTGRSGGARRRANRNGLAVPRFERALRWLDRVLRR